MQRFFDDDGLQFETLIALGQARSGLSEVGEVLTTVAGIVEGDRPGWVAAWTALAQRLEHAGDAADAAGHGRSARDLWLRAANYANKASFLADATDDADAFGALWSWHRDLWDRAAVRLDPPAQPVRIPMGDVEMEGYLWCAADDGVARRTLVCNNGSDGPVTDMWAMGAADALARGWNALTFDGPGQNATLHRLGVGFRPDWEVVISAVVDWCETRPEIDARRLAVIGNSQGGYWVPRAAAFEHRLAAIVADPGVVDVGASWLAHLPQEMIDLLDDPASQGGFDMAMELGMQADPDARYVLTVRARPFCLDSFWELYRSLRDYRLDAETIGQIRCPTLVTSPEHEQFWPGQSQTLFEALTTDERHLLEFTEAEGASWHCEPVALGLRNQRILDWLDEVVPS
ncbi:MAG: hypothetical protein JJU45_04615 [Acidimicrobiia bacterium]|nr:hypothetical protein [Acidimicrobiia bacterium]